MRKTLIGSVADLKSSKHALENIVSSLERQLKYHKDKV